MSARTPPSRNYPGPSRRRVGLIAVVALSVAISVALPALGQDSGGDTTDLIELDPDAQAAVEPTVEPHQQFPTHLAGETELDRFENAWQSGYSSIEAAMIANSEHRGVMPSIPEGSGSGERVVYSLTGQRVWLVADDGYLIDSYLVSGRDWMPNVGTFRVWGKARRTRGYDPDYTMNFMVRFAVGSHGGTIGFHDLPLYRGRPVQTLDDLGTANLSGGCVRQDSYHARMMFSWTEIGTTVVVIP